MGSNSRYTERLFDIYIKKARGRERVKQSNNFSYSIDDNSIKYNLKNKSISLPPLPSASKNGYASGKHLV